MGDVTHAAPRTLPTNVTAHRAVSRGVTSRYDPLSASRPTKLSGAGGAYEEAPHGSPPPPGAADGAERGRRWPRGAEGRRRRRAAQPPQYDAGHKAGSLTHCIAW